MKTKFLSLCFVLFCATQLFAYDYEYKGIYYNLNEEDKTASVTSNNGRWYESDYSGSVVIPSTISRFFTSYTVISIEENAFRNSKELKSVTIPNSIIWIGSEAFSMCSNLTSVIIPDTGIRFGYNVFGGCCNINRPIYNSHSFIYYPKNHKGSYTIPSGIKVIETSAFSGSLLSSVSIPNTVTSIGNLAFGNCSSLTLVNIPNSVTTIGDNAFQYCSGLISVNIPNSVTNIGEYAFYYCSGLTSVNIPSSVRRIGNRAFANCEYLEKINLGSGIENIGSCVFLGDFRLEEIGIGSATTPNIRYDTFYGINKKFAIYVPRNVRDKYWTDPHWDGLKILIDEPGRSSYATIHSAWIDSNVYVKGEKGMNIHVKFSTYEAYQQKITVRVYFRQKNGTYIRGSYMYQNYTTSNGDAIVLKSSLAPYESTKWDDFVLFMPYSALNLPWGKNLELQANIWIYNDTAGKWLTQTSKDVDFIVSNEYHF